MPTCCDGDTANQLAVSTVSMTRAVCTSCCSCMCWHQRPCCSTSVEVFQMVSTTSRGCASGTVPDQTVALMPWLSQHKCTAQLVLLLLLVSSLFRTAGAHHCVCNAAGQPSSGGTPSPHGTRAHSSSAAAGLPALTQPPLPCSPATRHTVPPTGHLLSPSASACRLPTSACTWVPKQPPSWLPP